MEKSYIESFAKEGNLALWLQNEFYYLQSEYKNILMTIHAWLSYRIKDAAQKIIWKALSKMDSFLSVLYSKKNTHYSNYPFRAVNNEHIQLLHDGINHWILSFCSSDRAQICDSLRKP